MALEQGLTIDLRRIGIELKMVEKTFATVIRKQIRAAVLESGAELLAAAKRNAAWSTGASHPKEPGRNIPDATTLRTSFGLRSAGVTLRTSEAKAPHARPYEFGSGGNGGRLRFKVFGNDEVWREVASRPFFFKAVKEVAPDIDRRIMAAVDEAVRAAGFR